VGVFLLAANLTLNPTMYRVASRDQGLFADWITWVLKLKDD